MPEETTPSVLPVTPPAPQPTPPSVPAPVAPATAGAGKKIVFVVEDDVFLVKAYQTKFAKEGMEVWVASDGKEALTYLEKTPPSVVLLDLMLPQVSGFDILEAIRKSPTWAKTPVLILSNLGQVQDIERGKQLGATDYIVKANVKINDIVAKVKGLMV